MDVTDVVELRVHGVSGTPPQDLLDRPLVTQVAGDGIAGFYRPRLLAERDDVAGPSAERTDAGTGAPLEGYVWGGLTSGSPGRALWLVLLPFTLINVAARLRPAAPGERLLAAWWYLSRLLALGLTLLLVLASCGVGLDLLGWQCAAPSHPCSGGSPGWLVGGVSGLAVGRRQAVGVAVPLLVLAALTLISGRAIARYESVEDRVDAHDDPCAVEPRLDSAWMWRGEHLVRRLRHLHLLAGVAVVLATLAAPTESGWRWVALAVSGLTVLAVVGLLLRRDVCGRGANPRWWAPTIWTIWGVLAAVSGITLGLLLADALPYPTPRPPKAPTRASGLPYYAGAVLWLFGVVLVLFLVLAVVLLRLRARRDRTPPEPAMAGLGGLAVGLLGGFAAGAFSAGAYIFGAAWLKTGSLKPNFRDVTAAAKGFDVPEVIRDAALVFAVSTAFILVAAVLLLGVAAIRYVRVGGDTRSRAAQAFAEDYPEVSGPAGRVRQIRRQFWLAGLVDRGGSIVGLLLLPGTVLTVVVTALLLLRPWSWAAHQADVLAGVPGGWLPNGGAFSAAYLQAVGAYAVVILLLALVTLGALAYRVSVTRRRVGILWDIASFWPRSAHPFAAPCYAERSVPDLTTRLRWYAADADPAAYPSGAVVLAGHSQGSVISAAVLLQLARSDSHAAAEARVLPRLAFLSYGCVLRRLYSRYFPAYLGTPVLGAVAQTVSGPDGVRWRNLWRHSDPIGGPVENGGATRGIDCRLRDPRFAVPAGDLSHPPTHGHSDYPSDPAFQAEVAVLAREL